MADVWASLVGQQRVVEQLKAALDHPVHAYAFVGKEGYGTAVGARVFAGELVAATDPSNAERHRRLALGGRHPAVWEVFRSGASLSAEQAREIVRRANMAPPEGTLQVIVPHEFHLAGGRAPILLKAIEEPPPMTVFVILADEIAPDLVTIASRCVRIEFGPLSAASIEAELIAAGADVATASAAAISSGGDLDRARLLVTDPDLSARRAHWASLPTRLDGTGSTVAVLVDEIRARIDASAGPLEARAAEETAALEASYEALGAVPTGVRRELVDRHKRELRQVRSDELRAGFAATLDTYRRSASEGGAAAARNFVRASEIIDGSAAELVRNPNESLLLQSMLLRLPATGPA